MTLATTAPRSALSKKRKPDISETEYRIVFKGVSRELYAAGDAAAFHGAVKIAGGIPCGAPVSSAQFRRQLKELGVKSIERLDSDGFVQLYPPQRSS